MRSTDCNHDSGEPLAVVARIQDISHLLQETQHGIVTFEQLVSIVSSLVGTKSFVVKPIGIQTMKMIKSTEDSLGSCINFKPREAGVASYIKS